MCAEVGKGEHHPPPPSAAARLPLPPRRVRSRRRSSRAMADKENSAYAAAAAPRITRASAKRAAAVTAVAVAAKRKRVALSEIPTLPNAAPQPHTKPKKSSSQVAKPKKKSLSSLSLPAPPKPAAGAADETGDPQLCAPYASDIYSYLRSMEVQAKRRPAADYIERVQMDVTPNMRGILVDWLVEVAEEYKLVSDTLYLTVSYIDRFLSSNTLNRQKLQRQHARFAKSSEMGAASSHAFQVGVSRSTPAAMCTARSRSSSANREPLRTGGTLRLHPSPPLTGPCL